MSSVISDSRVAKGSEVYPIGAMPNTTFNRDQPCRAQSKGEWEVFRAGKRLPICVTSSVGLQASLRVDSAKRTRSPRPYCPSSVVYSRSIDGWGNSFGHRNTTGLLLLRSILGATNEPSPPQECFGVLHTLVSITEYRDSRPVSAFSRNASPNRRAKVRGQKCRNLRQNRPRKILNLATCF